MDKFHINCRIGDEYYDIDANVDIIPDQPGPCYMLTRDGEFLAHICKIKGTQYAALGETTLQIEEIQAIGQQIDEQLQ
jgi:hypothetical protein